MKRKKKEGREKTYRRTANRSAQTLNPKPQDLEEGSKALRINHVRHASPGLGHHLLLGRVTPRTAMGHVIPRTALPSSSCNT